ncbi:MAG: 50S ribosomal protein L2, partial [Kiritimatiellae bacterium]|nr:50S ribosomal protein L2 [Kiritimatiellia bacterium]
MAIRKHKPTTASQRHTELPDFSDITRNRPEKSLTSKKTKKAGRNCYGRVTVRHRGGGHKQRY